MSLPISMRLPAAYSSGRIRHKRGRCPLPLFLFGIAAMARGQAVPAQVSVEKSPAASQNITYSNGQLRIIMVDSTMAEVLAKVAAITGVKIELPEGVSNERLPTVEAGPGPAPQVLASLLSDSNLDYVIQASDKDPDKIQSVLLLPRGKRDNIANANEPPGRPRNPYARAAAVNAQPVEVAPPEPAVQPQTVASVANSVNPQPSATQTGQTTALDQNTPPPPQPDLSSQLPPAQPDLSGLPTLGQPLKTNVPATFPVGLPPVLNQQNITQQLQQMYQQRMQMAQQGPQALSSQPPNPQ